MTERTCNTCQSFDRKIPECTNPPNSHFHVEAGHKACSAHLDVAFKVADIVREFIEKNDVNCPENIYQSDLVSENAAEFIERLCEVVGYKEEAEDEPS